MAKTTTAFILLIFFSAVFSHDMLAQDSMRIHYKDGRIGDMAIELIDSITFAETGKEQSEASLIGEWFYGSRENGYYEVLTFNNDKTYTGYDYFLEYGFDTWTYGTYMSMGMLLNLWSNGFGYRRTYRWFVTALTGNALAVMTQMGSYTYYRVQNETYRLKVGETSYACKDGERYLFSDGTKVTAKDGKLEGFAQGTTYVLKQSANSGLIVAYKVIVE